MATYQITLDSDEKLNTENYNDAMNYIVNTHCPLLSTLYLRILSDDDSYPNVTIATKHSWGPNKQSLIFGNEPDTYKCADSNC